MGRTLGGWVVAWAALAAGGLPARGGQPPAAAPAPDDERANAARLLEARGLKRAGNAYVLPAEQTVRRRVAGLESLVAQNQEAVRRRQLRASVTNQSHSLFLGLQGQRLALNATIANNPIPGPDAPGMPRGLTMAEERSAAYGQILDDTDVQLRNVTNVVAGVAADNEADAAEVLARQDEFAQATGTVAQSAADVARAYASLRADPQVAAALDALARAEGQPVALGPLDDYPARLGALRTAMDATRVLTVLPGRAAPDYTIASLLAESTRRRLRLSLGRLDDWNRRAAAGTQHADPAERAAIEAQLAALRPRFVRSVALVRQAYDDLRARPLASTGAPLPPRVPDPVGFHSPAPASSAADLARFRTLVEQQRAGLRAAFVSELERALRVTREPLERRADGLWLRARLNGTTDVALRLDERAETLRLPEGLAATAGIAPPATTAWELVPLPDGTSVRARRATARSLAIGGFEAGPAPCLVVAGEDAAAVLGAGVLKAFVTRIDTTTEPPALALTRIDLTPIPPRRLPPGAPPPKLRSHEPGR